jgi:hypothetical protein
MEWGETPGRGIKMVLDGSGGLKGDESGGERCGDPCRPSALTVVEKGDSGTRGIDERLEKFDKH